MLEVLNCIRISFKPSCFYFWQCIPIIVCCALKNDIEAFENFYYCEKCATTLHPAIDLKLLMEEPHKFIEDIFSF